MLEIPAGAHPENRFCHFPHHTGFRKILCPVFAVDSPCRSILMVFSYIYTMEERPKAAWTIFCSSKIIAILLVPFLFILLLHSQLRLKSVSDRSDKRSRSEVMPADRRRMPDCNLFQTGSGMSAVPTEAYSVLLLT